EDERDLNNLIRRHLEDEGHRVVQVFDGPAAVLAVQQERPDLLILDWMLPQLDGLEVCRRVRRESIVPILMLTARSEEIDRVLGPHRGHPRVAAAQDARPRRRPDRDGLGDRLPLRAGGGPVSGMPARLRWQLTLSHLAAIACTLLSMTAALVVVASLWIARASDPTEQVAQEARTGAGVVAGPLQRGTPAAELSALPRA